jgi:HK97 family phage major capsid protein
MTDFTPQKVMEAVNELMVAHKSKDALDAEKARKIEGFLTEQEKKNQDLVKELAEQKKANLEVEEKLASLEKSLSRPDVKGDEKVQLAAEVKAAGNYLRGATLTAEEMKYLRTDKDTDGGYLVEGELYKEILKNITEISPMRNIARVRTTRTKKGMVPRRSALMTAYWTAEGKQGTASNSNYAREDIYLNKITALAEVTLEEISDASFDIEMLVQQDAAEEIAAKEGTAFVTGSGINKPEGFVNTTIITPRNSGVADDITIDSIISLTGDLKTGYNPVFAMNRTTIANLRTKKAGDGHYLWVAGNVAAGVPNTLCGFNYVEVPDMADIAANAVPVAFGDFARGYMIVDKPGVIFIRDQYSLSDYGKVRLVVHKRTGGGIVLPEAIKLLKCSA